MGARDVCLYVPPCVFVCVPAIGACHVCLYVRKCVCMFVYTCMKIKLSRAVLDARILATEGMGTCDVRLYMCASVRAFVFMHV
jgi:hypothetical protein